MHSGLPHLKWHIHINAHDMGLRNIQHNLSQDFQYATDVHLLHMSESFYFYIQIYKDAVLRIDALKNVSSHQVLMQTLTQQIFILGKDTTIRPGWLTVGPDLTSSNFDPEQFGNYFNTDPDAFLTGCTDEIERLRPKSPPPKVHKDDGQSGRGGGRGRGGGGGTSGRGSLNAGSRGGGGPPRGRGGGPGGPPKGGGWRGRGGGGSGYSGGRGR